MIPLSWSLFYREGNGNDLSAQCHGANPSELDWAQAVRIWRICHNMLLARWLDLYTYIMIYNQTLPMPSLPDMDISHVFRGLRVHQFLLIPFNSATCSSLSVILKGSGNILAWRRGLVVLGEGRGSWIRLHRAVEISQSSWHLNLIWIPWVEVARACASCLYHLWRGDIMTGGEKVGEYGYQRALWTILQTSPHTWATAQQAVLEQNLSACYGSLSVPQRGKSA